MGVATSTGEELTVVGVVTSCWVVAFELYTTYHLHFMLRRLLLRGSVDGCSGLPPGFREKRGRIFFSTLPHTFFDFSSFFGHFIFQI